MSEHTNKRTETHACDLIDRQAAIDAMIEDKIQTKIYITATAERDFGVFNSACDRHAKMLKELPPAQPTLYGYNIEHLELIARVLQKENLPPERIVKVLTDIGRIVAIVTDEFEEALRKAAEQCTI